METDAELLRRYKHVQELVDQAIGRVKRCKSDWSHDQAARWTGSLNFTLLQIEDKLAERGLATD